MFGLPFIFMDYHLYVCVDYLLSPWTTTCMYVWTTFYLHGLPPVCMCGLPFIFMDYHLYVCVDYLLSSWTTTCMYVWTTFYLHGLPPVCLDYLLSPWTTSCMYVWTTFYLYGLPPVCMCGLPFIFMDYHLYVWTTLQESLSASKSRKQVRSATPVGLLQTSRLDVDLLDDPVVSVIKSLNRFCTTQDVGAAEREERGRSAAGPVQPKCTESVSTLSSVSTALNSVLLRSKDVLLLVAEVTYRNVFTCLSLCVSELSVTRHPSPACLSDLSVSLFHLSVSQDFYRSDHFHLRRFLLVPDSLDQWAESMQQKLLGYQEQMRTFLNTSREELETQLSLLADLLLSVPVVLISNHEQQQGAGLIEEMGRVRMKQEETLAASEEDKRVNIHQLRVSLRDEELQTLVSREELRQQQLHSAICSFHLELQVSVRLRGEEFVTSLAALTEQLLSQLDELPTLGGELTCDLLGCGRDLHTWGLLSFLFVSIETNGPGAEMRRTHGSVSRTWSGIPYLLPPTNSNAAPTTITTASLTTSRCTLGHQAVIEQRDAAVKRFEQLLRAESSRSNDDKPRRLSELQSWNAHWRQQIHTLKHTHLG
ncbi:coiled-coil domain-containing protein 180-like isoform X2 [Pseudoliparis swirei]|uniref:coiled-coil domain-containing protein 180-like isoform X2 n=1 Tax=Pseudoliparis swirei TaxID=2059687 RepID=UPI0024BF0FA5|nr:coiled-coil domain-containing protein 180-like isoform X2 [Pseudoliparis swirei]